MSDNDTIYTHGFDNPRAKAYFAEFIEDATLDFLEDTFEYDTDDLGETSDALIAAEIVAGLIGSAAAGLPADVQAACSDTPKKKLLTKTRAAVRAALEDDSALREYWQDNGIEPWLKAVNDLLDRLT